MESLKSSNLPANSRNCSTRRSSRCHWQGILWMQRVCIGVVVVHNHHPTQVPPELRQVLHELAVCHPAGLPVEQVGDGARAIEAIEHHGLGLLQSSREHHKLGAFMRLRGTDRRWGASRRKCSSGLRRPSA